MLFLHRLDVSPGGHSLDYPLQQCRRAGAGIKRDSHAKIHRSFMAECKIACRSPTIAEGACAPPGATSRFDQQQVQQQRLLSPKEFIDSVLSREPASGRVRLRWNAVGWGLGIRLHGLVDRGGHRLPQRQRLDRLPLPALSCRHGLGTRHVRGNGPDLRWPE